MESRNSNSVRNVLKLSCEGLDPETKLLYYKAVTNREHNSFEKENAGFDVYIPEGTIVPKPSVLDGLGHKINLGIKAEMVRIDENGKEESDHWVLEPRSSNSKYPLQMANGRGIMDKGYRGPIFISFRNTRRSDTEVVIEKGVRLAQICTRNLESFDVILTDDLSESERGANGHGSTGA